MFGFIFSLLIGALAGYIAGRIMGSETSALRNGELWHADRPDRDRRYWKPTTSFRRNLQDYITWIERRMEYIDQSPSMGLYW